MVLRKGVGRNKQNRPRRCGRGFKLEVTGRTLWSEDSPDHRSNRKQLGAEIE